MLFNRSTLFSSLEPIVDLNFIIFFPSSIRMRSAKIRGEREFVFEASYVVSSIKM